MRDAAAKTAKKTAQKIAQKTIVAKGNAKDSAKETALHRRYGAIGISAVAAAARYQGAAKNPAYAPVAHGWFEPADEAA
jgi:hypothetical protein